MKSRQLKALRIKQARAHGDRARGWVDVYERKAADANAAGLLNEAIEYENKAAYWRARVPVMSSPAWAAQHAGRVKSARLARERTS